MKVKKLMVGLTALTLMAGSGMPQADAAYHNYDRGRYYNSSYGGYFDQHPYVQKALIGGGVGALIGGLVSRNSDTVGGAVKGGLVGSAVGLGYEYLKNKRF